MHKEYPYLENSYIYNTDEERRKRALLKDIDSFLNQRQYIKITLLDWHENPIREIEGEISSGSISKVADSPVRRTAELSCAVDAKSYSVDDGKADFAINKKIYIEIGVLNETPHYPEFPIFWFPQGVFFISSFAINSSSTGSTNISLSLKDKMAMLNGDVGGKLPASVIFDSMDTQLPTGEYIEKKVIICDIIRELVNHYGGEDLNKIVIEGVPRRIRRVMQWNGDKPLYRYLNEDNEIGTSDYSANLGKTDFEISYTFTTEPLPNYTSQEYETYYKGDDIGYIMDDFVIVDELTGAPGENVTDILDKIKTILGNYEYFYDVFGVFHFREIKNYNVTTQARTLLDEMAENDYLVETNNERSIFTFNDTSLLTSISVTPQYENIKNDYIIEGQNQTDDGLCYNIRYHLAIDNKPKPIGKDNRSEIIRLLDNNEEIAVIEEKIKDINININKKTVSNQSIVFQIRNALSIIQQRTEHYNAQDEELFKILSDIIEKEKNEIITKNTIADKLPMDITGKYSYYLAELKKWIASGKSITSKTNNDFDLISNMDDFWKSKGTKLSDVNIELQSKQQELSKIKNKQREYNKILNFFKNKVYNTAVKDYANKTKLSISEVETLYKNAKTSQSTIATQIRQLESKIAELTDKQKTLKKQQTESKEWIKETLEVMEQDQEKIKEKEILLYGKNGGLVSGYYAYLDTIVESKTKKDNYKSFYKDKDSLFYQYHQILGHTSKPTYTGTDIDSLKLQLEKLNEDLANLQNQHHAQMEKISLTEEVIHSKDYRKNVNYYGIYPDNKAENDNTITYLVLYIHPRDGHVTMSFCNSEDTEDKLLDSENESSQSIGNFNRIYIKTPDTDSQLTLPTFIYWDGEVFQELEVLEIFSNEDSAHQYYAYDWRTKLYLDGLKGVNNGTDKGYYYEELAAFWSQTYDLQNQCFYGEEEKPEIHYKSLTMGNYYLDFLDAVTTSFGEWSIDNIGRRSDIIVNEEVNCLFQPEIPNIILIPTTQNQINTDLYNSKSLESAKTIKELRIEAENNNYPFTQIGDDIYNNISTGGYKNGAFDQIKYELYLHTRYQKSISFTSIPVFYLEPNSRITIDDTITNTYGDFVVQSISLTLGPGANMSISCNETLERF